MLEGDIPTCRKCQITEVEEEDDAFPPSASKDIAATPLVEEMNTDMDLTSRNSNKLPFTSYPSHLVTPVLLSSTSKFSYSQVPNSKPVESSQANKRKTGMQRPQVLAQRQKRIAKVPVINMDVDSKLQEVETPKKEDKWYLWDMFNVIKSP